MSTDSIKRSVDSLQKIYAIIIGLAISQSINTSINFEGGKWNQALFFNNLPALISLFAFLVPFYQGMNRHLDLCYVEKRDGNTQGALLFDFAVFCIESCLLFVFTKVFLNDLTGYYIIACMLAVDMVWAFVSHWIHYRKFDPSIRRWAVINFVTLVVGTLILSSTYFPNKAVPFLCLSMLRTVADYFFCWKFYFPEDHLDGWQEICDRK